MSLSPSPSSSPSPFPALKVVILGSSGVGKTSIVHRLTGDTFLKDGGPTCGADFHSYTATVDGQSTKLQIWDTAGQERFRSISKAYFRNAVGAVLVFDITDSDSFDALTEWLQDLEVLASPNAWVVVAANKHDLAGRREIGEAEVKCFCERHCVEVVDTSAASGEGIAAAFQRLALGVVMRVRAGTIEIPHLALGQASQPVLTPAKKRGCC
jgi:small GTP-binding protein